MVKHCYYWFFFRFKFSCQHTKFRRIPYKIIKCSWKKIIFLEKNKTSENTYVLDSKSQTPTIKWCRKCILSICQSPPPSITPHPGAECPLAGSIPLALLFLVEFKRKIYPHTRVFQKWKKEIQKHMFQEKNVSQTYFSKTKRRLLGLICQ